jgi:hypothetical protein
MYEGHRVKRAESLNWGFGCSYELKRDTLNCKDNTTYRMIKGAEIEG